MSRAGFYAAGVPDILPNAGSRNPPGWVTRAIVLFWGVFALMVVGRNVVGRLKSLLVMLLVSLFLSLAIEPAVNALARRGWRRGVATGVLLLSMVIASLTFSIAIGALVAEQVSNLVNRSPEYLTQIQDWVNRTFKADFDFDALIKQITTDGAPVKDLATNGLRFTSAAAGWIFQALGISLFTYYMVADGPKLRRAICRRLPPERQQDVLRAWEIAIHKTGGYIYSRALLALFSSIAHWIAFWIIGVPNAVALALWVGIVSQFLPVIGTYLAGVLPVLVTLIDSPIRSVWVIGFILLYQQLENYVFLPRVTARTMELHPAIAFGSAIAGGAILGPIGALLALPVAASIQAFAGVYGTIHDIVESPLTAPPADETT